MLRFPFALLASLMLCGTANAATYTFTAGTTTGVITTGAASTQDAGYYQIQKITFDTFIDATTGSKFTNLSSLNLGAGSLFNPTKIDFMFRGNVSVNPGTTGTFDFGDGAADIFDGIQFYTSGLTIGSSIFATNASAGGSAPATISSSGTLSLVVPPLPAVSGVPEPRSWAMMLVGFGMVAGAARYRRSVKVSLA